MGDAGFDIIRTRSQGVQVGPFATDQHWIGQACWFNRLLAANQIGPCQPDCPTI